MTRRRTATAIVVAALFAGLTGCSGPQSALHPAGDGADRINGLWWLLFAIATVVVAIVVLLVLVAVMRRRSEPATGPGGSWFVGIAGIGIPFAVLAVVFFFALSTMRDLATGESRRAGSVVRVVGRQWFWEVHYAGTRAVEANEIHIAVGRRVRVELTAPVGDVIHSFWVPQLQRKIDVIPGRTNVVDLVADHAGVYRGQCAEFCGIAHAQMAFVVIAQSESDYRDWLNDVSKPANVIGLTGDEKLGEQVMLGSCAYCHTVRGTAATGRIGPDLTHIASRRAIGAGQLPNTKGTLGGWVLDPQSVKPGNKMPPINLTGPQLQQLLAYLESLK